LLWIKTGIIVVGTDIFLIWATLLSLWQRDEYWRERGKDPKHALSAVTRWLWKNSLRCWSTLAIHMSTTTQRWPRVLPSPARRQSCTQVPEGDQHIKLAELRIRLRDEQSLEEGGRPPRSVDRSSPSSVPEAHLGWNIAEIELAEATRDRDAAREAAGGVESENKEPEATARCG
jgi:hypothetical protein